MRTVVATVLLGCAALAACGDGQGGSGSTAFDEGFNRKWRENFVASCVATASANAPAATAQKICGCVADRLDTLTVKEKMDLPAAKTDAAIAACRSA